MPWPYLHQKRMNGAGARVGSEVNDTSEDKRGERDVARECERVEAGIARSVVALPNIAEAGTH